MSALKLSRSQEVCIHYYIKSKQKKYENNNPNNVGDIKKTLYSYVILSIIFTYCFVCVFVYAAACSVKPQLKSNKTICSEKFAVSIGQAFSIIISMKYLRNKKWLSYIFIVCSLSILYMLLSQSLAAGQPSSNKYGELAGG